MASRNPVTLEFTDRPLEAHFREEYFQKILTLGRVCHLLAIFFFGVFGLWDSLLMEPDRSFIWSVVFSAVCFMFLAGLALSYLRMDIYRKIWQPLYTLYVLGTGIGFTIVSVWAGESFYKLYVGIIYCLIFNYAVIRLRFIWATPAGWFIVVFYLTGLAIFRDPDFQTLVTEAFMLSGIGALGMFVSYSLELSARKDFLLNLSLEEARQKANNVSARLEMMVADRTEQLSTANENLLKTIEREREVSAKLAEEERILQRNLSSLQQAEQVASLGYFERNWHTDSNYWSPGFHNLFGWEVGEIECTTGNFLRQVHPEETKRVSSSMVESAMKRIPMNIEFRALHKSGEALHIHAIATTIHDEQGTPLLTRGTFQNITEAKRLQAEHEQLEQQLVQAKKMEAIGTLAGGIAHDFNNILAAIIGYTELAQGNADKGKASPENLERILESAQRAAQLVKQILTFSRKMKPTLQPVDINHEIISAVNLLQQTIPRMIAIDLDLAQDIPSINGDATQIQQMLLNLASNASDAMPHGGKILFKTEIVQINNGHCSLCQSEFSGKYVLLHVSDTGQGMDEQTLEKIFDPFFTTKEVGKGTGLGLATVFGIIPAHNAHAIVSSQPGQGTAFNIYLPYPDEEVKSAPPPDQAEEVPTGSETILLVDDEEHILNIGSQFLSRNGYTVINAATGEEALDAYRQNGSSIDLVILDLSMPGMGGHKCLRELLSITPELKVIVASGYSRNGDLNEAMSSGAAALLQKPFSRAEMLKTVRMILDE